MDNFSVSVEFYDENDDDACAFFSCYMPCIPPYHPGDTIWLQRTVAKDRFPTMQNLPLSHYTIVRIEHDIDMTFGLQTIITAPSCQIFTTLTDRTEE
jgi:hypothetical protein